MSILLEFTIDAEAFELGSVLTPPPEMSLELERIVPAGPTATPFVWATGESQDSFEETVRSHPAVTAVTRVDRFENRGLYRIEWHNSPTDLIAAIQQSEAIILEARGTERWNFRLRFADQTSLSTFHNAVQELGLSIQIERTATLRAFDDESFTLTAEQREALVLALRRGYFASPSEVGLDELADKLGITRQALSKRIRRGNQKILEGVLGRSETPTD